MSLSCTTGPFLRRHLYELAGVSALALAVLVAPAVLGLITWWRAEADGRRQPRLPGGV